jgi:hypothetical protein
MADVYELAGRSRRTSERVAAALGTTVARWHLLSVVSQDALSVPEIARRLGQVREGGGGVRVLRHDWIRQAVRSPK